MRWNAKGVMTMTYADDADDDEEQLGWRRQPSKATPPHPLQEPSDSNLDQGRVWGINIYITSKPPSSNCSYKFCTKSVITQDTTVCKINTIGCC